MKKFKLLAFTFLVALIATVNVSAQEVGTVEELTECLTVNDNTCTLKNDISAGEFTGAKFTIAKDTKITLDLNGYKLSGKNSDEKVSTSLITNRGNLIIEDSSDVKTGTLEMSDTEVRLYTWGIGIFVICNTGELTINGGSLLNNGKTDVPYAVDNNSTSSNVKVTVNAGKLTGVAAIRAFANSETATNEIIINGGLLEGSSTGIWLQQPSARAGKASLVVNGGEIVGVGYPGAYADINNDEGSKAISMTFNGGIIRNKSDKYGAITFFPRAGSSLKDATINLEIKDALVINENKEVPALYFDTNEEISKESINITGGRYSTDIKEYIAEGLITKKVGDNFVVGKNNTIALTTPENGTVSIDKAEAIVGETVTITAKANDGYKLDVIKVVDSKEKELELTDGTFIMPNEPVKVTVTFIKTVTKVEIPTIDTEKEPEDVVLGVTDDKTNTDTLYESLKNNEDLMDTIKNTDVNVGVEITTVDKEEIEEEVIVAIEEKAGDATIAEYFDISVVVRKSEDLSKIDTIAELTKEIELMVLLPEKLKNADEDVERKYFIIREHDGEVKKLDATLSEDGKYLTFKSKQFSTYALAYEDTPIETEDDNKDQNDDNINDDNINNDNKYEEDKNDDIKDEEDKKDEVLPPQTGDNAITYILLSLIGILSFAFTGKYLKKYVTNN